MNQKKRSRSMMTTTRSSVGEEEELFFLVLTWLQAKSLMRFKCVSKLWRPIISDPLFATAHRARSRSGFLITFPDRDATACYSEQHFCFSTDRGKSVFNRLRLPLSDKDAVTEVIDGLVCFRDAKNGDRLSICNVTTHEIMALPESSLEGQGKPHYYFGFDPINHEYKVLNVCTFFEEEAASYRDGGVSMIEHLSRRAKVRRLRRLVVGKCEILTLGRDSSWRRIDSDAVPPHIFRDQSVCFNGALHWLVTNNTNPVSHITLSQLINSGRRRQDIDELYKNLVVFNLKDEKFRDIHLNLSDYPYDHIVRWQGRLALASTAKCAWEQLLTLHVLKEDSDSGSGLLEKIELPWAARKLQCYSAVGNVPTTGELLLTCSKLSSPLPVFYFDPQSGDFDIEVADFPSTSTGVGFHISYHVENVTPLRNILLPQPAQQ